jgi:hypothetical protein
MNFKKSYTSDINQFNNLSFKKILAMKNLNFDGKNKLDNLIKKNKKYKDIYNLIERKEFNDNSYIRGNKVYSQEKKNDNEREIFSYNSKLDKITKEEKMNTIYDEINSLKKKGNISTYVNCRNLKRNGSSNKSIFDDLNIEIPKSLKSNKSNVNINKREKDNSLINYRKINMSHKNLLKKNQSSLKSNNNNYIPKTRRKKYDEKDIKNWIDQEKNSFRKNFINFNENKVNFSNFDNINECKFTKNLKSKRNGIFQYYNNDYFQNELSTFESNLNKYKEPDFSKIKINSRNINDNLIKNQFLTPEY